MKKSTRLLSVFLVFVVVLCSLTGCAQKPGMYADAKNWAYFGAGEGMDADVFFICPTVAQGASDAINLSLDDEKTMKSFLGATNMELGIYDGDCRVFAPYYRQATLYAFSEGGQTLEKAMDAAYADVSEAFAYYMEHENNGRPIVLAGFSQGAELVIRLMQEHFGKPETDALLVAAYAIGWRLTEDEVARFPQLRPATGASDTGVIICFSSEAEYITQSMMIPAGVKSHSINPLNWRTDATPAQKEQNLGACFTDYSGAIVKEIPALCGAYIDETRGALKVTDVTAEEYPPHLPLFEDGIYHLYDYQFFYRNLQQNVSLRLEEYLSKQA